MSGPKTVTCCICQQTVNKAQTLQVGNGRACRSHEGVDTKAQQAQEALEAQHQKGREKPARRAPEPVEPLSFTPKCFGCNHEGVHARDWFLRLLVLGEKYELTYGKPLNPFDVAECQKAYSELKGKVPLFHLEYNPKKKKIWLHDYTAHQAGLMVGVIMLCQGCCDKNGIDPMPHMKNITFDQLANVSVITEAFVMPVVRQAANEEIQQSN